MQSPKKIICEMATPDQLGFLHFFLWGWPNYIETFTNYRKKQFLQCKSSFFRISQSHPTIMTPLHTINCMKPSRTRIAILHIANTRTCSSCPLYRFRCFHLIFTQINIQFTLIRRMTIVLTTVVLCPYSKSGYCYRKLWN